MKWGPAEEIAVDISPDRVVFREADASPLEWLPVIYIVLGERRLKVASVGEPPTDGVAAVRVQLFASERPPAGVSKYECLEAFFTAGMRAMLDRHLFRRRPVVLVHGSDQLSQVLGGYERDLINNALQQAGARTVRWPEDPLQS